MFLSLTVLLSSCSRPPDPNTFTLIIENNPTNLDPRVGTDAQSERIYELVFDSLLARDEHFEVRPQLAESWQVPDPRTYIFHLRSGVRFHDGRPLTANDVKWTFDSVLQGLVRSPKKDTYKSIASIEAIDPATVVFHLKEPDSTLLWNLSEGAIGIVPANSGAGFNRHPIGSGPFKFVSAEQDQDVVLERNDDYWGAKPHIRRVRFAIVPDGTTRALELRKGSADAALNALTADTVYNLTTRDHLVLERTPGTIYAYLAMNLRDPILSDVRVRQALAYAIDREAIITYLMRGQARSAASVLPPQHWAFDGSAYQYPYDPGKARVILDAAGYKPGPDGFRFHLKMKTSTEDSTRVFVAVLQQQLREVGIALDIRSYEFATFYADVLRGDFQLFSLRWVGGNEDPDIFQALFDSSSFPPKRFNRGFYSNPQADALIAAGRIEPERDKRRRIYSDLQRVLNQDLPYIHLWYYDNVMVHTARVTNVHLSPSGDYNFLKTVELRP